MSSFNVTYIDYLESEGFDERQMIEITIVQRSMGVLSMLGSGYVIQDVIRNDQKRVHTFHRLMVGLSIADLVFSFSHVMSTLPIPKGYHILAVGSVATCDAQGFVTLLTALTTMLYNCSLTTYYLVQLKHNWPNRRIKALEKWLHVLPWSVGLLAATISLTFKGFGPGGFNCSGTAGYPLECLDPDSSVECIRGSPNVFRFTLLVVLIILVLAVLYVCITMYKVYRSVSDIEIKARRYSLATYFRQDVNYRMRSRRVMIQGILYSAVLILINLVGMINIGASEMLGRSIYELTILQYTFWPLQGFFNALIYSIPIFQRMNTSLRESLKNRRESLKDKRERNKKNTKEIEPNDDNMFSSICTLGNQSKVLDNEKVEEEQKKEIDVEEGMRDNIQKRSETNASCPGIIIDEFKERVECDRTSTGGEKHNNDDNEKAEITFPYPDVLSEISYQSRERFENVPDDNGNDYLLLSLGQYS